MAQRILIAEDDAIQGSVLQTALERRGHDAEIVTNGLDALRRLRNGGYDLGILDYHIPEVNGLAAARLLQDFLSEEERPRLIAVTVAARELSEKELASGARSFDAVVSKQDGLAALLAAVNTNLTEAAAIKTAAEIRRTKEAPRQRPTVVLPGADRLQDNPRDPPPHGDGQIHAISLAALKHALGPEWPRIALRAMTKAERIIRNGLSTRDVLSRSGDHGFLIWFNANSVQRNDAILAAAVRDMRLRFLTDFGEDIRPSVCTSSWAIRRLMPANTA